MTKKIFAPLATVALMALVAVSLIASGGSASAAVNSVTASPATVEVSSASVLTIDADAAAGDVRILATAGDFTSCDVVDSTTDCTLVAPGPVTLAGTADRDITVDDTGVEVNTLYVGWTAPSTGPQTVTFTVIQGASTKTATVTVRGAVDVVEVTALSAESTSTTACVGTVANVITSSTGTGAAAGLDAAVLCARVVDSAGNRLPAQAVVFSTTAGTIAPLSDTTGATGQVTGFTGPDLTPPSTLTAGTTGTSGTTATITASAGGKTATTTVKFGGDPASCAITTNPTSVAVGGAATVNVDVKDSAGGPVPDGTVMGVAQVNPGQGANAAILNIAPTTTNGVASTTAIAAIQGAIALGATSVVTNPGATCTGTLIATGNIIPPDGGEEGDGGFSGEIADDGVSLVVFGGGSLEQLIEAAEDEDATTISATVDGEFIVYVVGAPDFVNEAFEDEFGGGIDANTAFILFKR